MTFRAHQPGCPCCDCAIFSDNFDRADADPVDGQWSVESGSWEVSSNELVSSNQGIVTNTFDYPTLHLHIEVKVKGSDGDRLRVVFNFTDTSNYTYAEIKVGTDARIRIVEVSGGIETQLGIDASVTAAASAWHTIEVCVTYIYAIITFGTVGVLRLTSVAKLPIGLATEAGGLFNDFVLSDAYSSVANHCPSCNFEQLCESCDGGIRKNWLKIVIAGLVDNDCACSSQNGTHIVPATTQSENICTWQGPAEEDPSCGIGGTDTITVTIETVPGDNVAFTGGIQIVLGSKGWQAFWTSPDLSKPYDCMNLTETLGSGRWNSYGFGGSSICTLSGTNSMVIEAV